MSNTRELTAAERSAIRKLVTGECANYCRDNGCLKLESACYMIGKFWTGSYCKYCRCSVLPLDNGLNAVLTSNWTVDMRSCAYCGESFVMSGKRAYCSAGCEKNALRRQKRDHMRKKRAGRGKMPL